MFFYSLIWVSLKKKGVYSLVRVNTLHKKLSFPLRICSVYVTKSAGNWGFGQIYWRKSQWKTSFFVQWQRFSIREQITKNKRNSAAMFLSSQVSPRESRRYYNWPCVKNGNCQLQKVRSRRSFAFLKYLILHFFNFFCLWYSLKSELNNEFQPINDNEF